MSRRVGIAALIWGASLLLSRVIGLVREAVIGRVLGGGAEADVYMAAFRIPDFLNYLLAGGALSIIFIPIFGGYLGRGEEEKGWEAYSVIANTVLLLLAVTLPVVWLATPWVVDTLPRRGLSGRRPRPAQPPHAHRAAGPGLPPRRRPAQRSPPGPRQAHPPRPCAAALHRLHHRRGPHRPGTRRLRVGRGGRERARAIRTAPARQPAGRHALATHPALQPPRPARLVLPQSADHAGLLHHRLGRTGC